MLRAIKSQQNEMREVVVMSPVESSELSSRTDDAGDTSNGHADSAYKVLHCKFVHMTFVVELLRHVYFSEYIFLHE